MNPRHTFSARIFFLVMIAFVLVACTPATAPAEAPTVAPTKPAPTEEAETEVTLRYFSQGYIWGGKTYTNISSEPLEIGEYEQYLVNEFKKTHPNVNVEITLLTAEGLQEKLTASIAAGEPPDVLELFPSIGATFWEQGLLENLDGTLTEDEEEDFGELIDDFRLFGPDGERHLHAYPSLQTTVFTAVNKSVLEEMGLEDLIPADPDRSWTFDEFRAALETIHEEDPNVYGYTTLVGTERFMFWHIMQFLEGNGASWWNEDYTACTANSSEGVDALQYLIDLERDGLLAPGITSNGFGEMYNHWFSKTAAMAPHWQGIFDETAQAIAEGSASEPFEIYPTGWPHAPGVEPTHFVDALSYMVFKQDDPVKREIAIEFAKFVNTTERQFEQAQATKNFPTRKSAAALNPFADDPAMDWVTHYVATTPPHRDGVFRPRFSEIRNLWIPHMQAAFSGEMSAKEALDQGCAEMNAIIERD